MILFSFSWFVVFFIASCYWQLVLRFPLHRASIVYTSTMIVCKFFTLNSIWCGCESPWYPFCVASLIIAHSRSCARQLNIYLRDHLLIPIDYISFWIHLITNIFFAPDCLGVVVMCIRRLCQILIKSVCNGRPVLIYFVT